MATKKSSDQTQEIVKVGEIPQHLIALAAEAGDLGLQSMETMQHHRIVNRAAIVQGMSSLELKTKYGEGTIIIPVADQVVAKRGESFMIVPVMFFDEYITWGDRNDKTGNKIREKSLDHGSKLAAKCKDPSRWSEIYPGGTDAQPFKMRHTHHLNFLCIIYSGELMGTLVCLSFSRSEFKKGMQFIGQLRMRRLPNSNGQPIIAPIWATVWEAQVGPRKNSKGEWWGIDLATPEVAWIKQQDMAPMKQWHDELLADYKAQSMEVGHAEAETVDAGEDSATVDIGNNPDKM